MLALPQDEDPKHGFNALRIKQFADLNCSQEVLCNPSSYDNGIAQCADSSDWLVSYHVQGYSTGKACCQGPDQYRVHVPSVQPQKFLELLQPSSLLEPSLLLEPFSASRFPYQKIGYRFTSKNIKTTLLMHKTKSTAHHAAWYNDSYNPFEKKSRSRDILIESDENKTFDDARDSVVPVFAQFLRRATRRLTYNPAFSSRHHSSLPRVEPIISSSKKDADDPSLSESHIPSEIKDPESLNGQRSESIWQEFKAWLGFREKWAVKPALAKIAQSTLANAPLGTKGKVLLEAFDRPNRPSFALVVKYYIRDHLIHGNLKARKLHDQGLTKYQLEKK